MFVSIVFSFIVACIFAFDTSNNDNWSEEKHSRERGLFGTFEDDL